jgi:hypothetical protein
MNTTILEAVDHKGSTKHGVVGIIDDIAICEAWHKPPFDDARFTAAIHKDGVWKRTSRYHRSADVAMLDALGIKYGDRNSQFAEFASLMLQIP